MNDDRGGVLAEIRRWVQAELMPWRFFRHEHESFEASVRYSVDTDGSVFRFTIYNGVVTFHEKPPEQYLAQLPSFEFYRNLRERGLLYHHFLQTCVTAFNIKGTAELAIDLDDLPDRTAASPVFAFQKVEGARNILLPDIDMLSWNFYLAQEQDDTYPFEEKADAAIFVGSTTGIFPITRTIVQQLAHQRLRSAVYFRGHPEVRFELPSIVQCDGPETEEMIRSLGLGSVARSWHEQLSYRYLISVDGNGATCSRVAISLKSNSVLMRYHSVNQLHYFHGLEAWKHYVPLERDSDVADNLALLRLSPELPRAIADDSRTFYRGYLSRIAIMHYTAELLRSYIATFGKTDSAAPSEPLQRRRGIPNFFGMATPTTEPIFAIDSFAHIARQGDLWSQPNGWLEADGGNWIESISIVPGPEIAPTDISVRAIREDGTESEPVEPWGMCGSRGQGRAIYGLRIELGGDAAKRLMLRIEARFLDGSRAGPTPAGVPCVSTTRAPLCAYRLSVYRR